VPARSDVAFLACLTAGATHEFRNILAIVKESAGLIDDLLRADLGAGASRERLQRAVVRIDAQVARGSALLTALNRLAHAAADRRTPMGLHEVVAHQALLSGRALRPRRQQVTVAPGEEATMLFATMKVSTPTESLAHARRLEPWGGSPFRADFRLPSGRVLYL
jgi:hypothetical protein